MAAKTQFFHAFSGAGLALRASQDLKTDNNPGAEEAVRVVSASDSRLTGFVRRPRGGFHPDRALALPHGSGPGVHRPVAGRRDIIRGQGLCCRAFYLGSLRVAQRFPLVVHLDCPFPVLLPPPASLVAHRDQRAWLCAGGGLRSGATLPRLPVHLAARVCARPGLAATPGLFGVAAALRRHMVR